MLMDSIDVCLVCCGVLVSVVVGGCGCCECGVCLC